MKHVQLWHDRQRYRDIFNRELPFSPMMNKSSSLPVIHTIVNHMQTKQALIQIKNHFRQKC